MNRLFDYLSLFALILYIPVGVILLLLRLTILAHIIVASYILHSCYSIKRFVLHVMKLALGVWINTNALYSNQFKHTIIVSNSVTVFDHLVLHICCDCVTPHSRVIHWYGSYCDPKSIRSEGANEFQKERSIPVHLLTESHPSGATDDATLLGHRLLESADCVQPVALKVYRPFIDTWMPHQMHWIAEFLLLLFLPFTQYSLWFLEPINRLNPIETDTEFMMRITKNINRILDPKQSRTATADDISNMNDWEMSPVVGTGMHKQDSSLPVKRNRHLTLSTATEDTTFRHLIPAVNEVLKDVPADRISAALLTSGGDVDEAIDCLLGCQEQVIDMRISSTAHDILPTSQLNTGTDVFCSSSADRQKSLRERREALLAYARRRHFAVQSG